MRRLQFHHREIMRRLFAGRKQCEIASDMGLSEVSVSRIVNDPLFRRERLRVQENTDKGIVDFHLEVSQAADMALDCLKEILQDETMSPRLRFQAAKWLLDRAGVRKSANASVPGVEKEVKRDYF